MPAGRILLLFVLAAGLCRGEEAAAPPPAAAAVAAVESREGSDLDFSDDFTLTSQRPKPRPPAGKGKPGRQPAHAAPRAPAAETGRAWIYWTLGATALTGGVAWFVHREMETAPAPTRTEEVFTDGTP